MNVRPRIADQQFSVSDLIRAAAELATRVEPAIPRDLPLETAVFTGRILAEDVQPGLLATAHDITYLGDGCMGLAVDRSLVFGLLLAGETDRLEIEGQGPVTQAPGEALLLGFPGPTQSSRAWRAGQRSHLSGFVLTPVFFERFADMLGNDGLAGLREQLDAGGCRRLAGRSARLADLARRTLDHPYGGPLGLMFLESNTLALVIEVAGQWGEDRRLLARLGRRPYEQAMAARDILDAELAAPPKTLDLARRVGSNVTSLQSHFRAVFGTTIFGYVRTRRLQMAHLMLVEHGLGVAETGYRVGFASPAAFTAAYRRHFGQPPGRAAALSR
ncbi:helix-turn-helix transcriptional regulator [Zavarzinia compransoris]|uniref:AraC family transcriptional regulator n=1 Tax=Zavarzinia compransoris TaxID=1264899 RepID=A0A317E905_9PROT|nr:AraC family transcriptional regulator [Zavarzinia compransoris]PWR21793.1 AraC family transcriptional regulator [Zavarzinia compransoris]TDP45407.1 AraC family transcriptional regulator [Zavarzinia compransoris]